MKFIDRFRGGGKSEAPGGHDTVGPELPEPDAPGPDAPEPEAAEPEIDAAERERELAVLREEQRRLDELAQRQLRYARYAWQPPAQGGERRAADPEDAAPGAEKGR
jgi:hypothetical protein